MLTALLGQDLDRVNHSPRVVAARQQRARQVEQLFVAKGVPYPPPAVLVRILKHEDQLELWAGKGGERLTLIKSYPICSRSGGLGPKRRLGDLQVPEGFYRISQFNPVSNFHLSLRVNYPNASDRVLSDRKHPGGDIFIHGSCVTIGCIPIEDGPIEELFLSLLDGQRAHRGEIPVHIFPARMDDDGMALLQREASATGLHLEFWKSLKPGYDAFERTRKVPRVSVDRTTGAYRIEVVE
ncbi:MAG: hypothetical protein JXR83_03385 [Deltaproteobacteria bacterium]|nr:hypothetical protein [Deltaproteobacteria bacterium]